MKSMSLIRNEAKSKRGITLIALVITIIVMLILAGVAINWVLGDDGIIVKTQLSAFATEMKKIKENVTFREYENTMEWAEGNAVEAFTESLNLNNKNIEILDTLKQEIMYTRDGYPSDKETSDYSVQDFQAKLQVDNKGNVPEIYMLDAKIGDGLDNTYIYDRRTGVVFKIPPTNIGGKTYHSYECASRGKGGENEPVPDQIIQEESDVVQISEVKYYAPNLNGFNSQKTSLVYYSDDFLTTKEITAQEYMQAGQKNVIEFDGQTYTLHDYKKLKWANAKTTANGLECWWVWIPRYAYKINNTSSTTPIDIIYIDVNNKQLADGSDLPTGYIPHTAFTVDGEELKGIWMSKYEPSSNLNYYPDSSICYEPDMEGFDPNNTYIELYDKDSASFKGEVKVADANLNTVNSKNEWHDYANRIWANIKTNANGIECWWVWIPRYAYQVEQGATETNVIFIDLNNKPIDKVAYGEELPEGFIVHPAFTPTGSEDGKNLKGIWMSKYEPSSNLNGTPSSSVCYAPDMEGFDPANTYIELFDGTTFSEEKLLSEVNLDTINNKNKWYDYKNKIWANVKTTANGFECWWVWIPRYAYQITPGITEASIIFIDLDNKPIDKEMYGEELPEGFIVHPAFTPTGNEGGKNLKGNWMSKYEPSWK